jgi:hypothetical protein
MRAPADVAHVPTHMAPFARSARRRPSIPRTAEWAQHMSQIHGVKLMLNVLQYFRSTSPESQQLQ